MESCNFWKSQPPELNSLLGTQLVFGVSPRPPSKSQQRRSRSRTLQREVQLQPGGKREDVFVGGF